MAQGSSSPVAIVALVPLTPEDPPGSWQANSLMVGEGRISWVNLDPLGYFSP